MNAKEYIESEYGTKHLKNVMQLEDETSLFALMDEYANLDIVNQQLKQSEYERGIEDGKTIAKHGTVNWQT